MTRPLVVWLVLGFLAGLPPAVAEGPAEPIAQPLDRIVAVVDEDPILYSEIVRARAFGLDPQTAEEYGASSADLERRLLDQLIEQRLRLHEVERHDLAAVPSAAVDRQVATIVERFGGGEALDAELLAAGLDRAALRERVDRQLRVLAFVEERLSARVFVSDDAVVDHYETVFANEMFEAGRAVPPFDQVRDSIRRLIEERALAEEIALWTQDLRQRARIIDLLDRPVDSQRWPPVVLRLESNQPPSRR